MKKDTYFDLIVVKNGEKTSLCVAPICSGINEGDIVRVYGRRAEVVSSCTVACGSEMWEFVKQIYEDAEPTKITEVYRKSAIDWEDEDNE